MSHPAAHTALQRRFLISPVISVLAQAALVAVVARAVGVPLDWPVLGGLALLVFAALEVGVQRARARRLAEVVPLFRGIIDGADAEVRVSWARGLPRIEAGGEHPFAVHLESAGARLRLGFTVQAHAAASAWLVSRQPEDFPTRLETRLGSRLRRLSADDATLCALSIEGDAAEVMLARPGVLATLRTMLATDAPRAASLEIGTEDIRWDVALHPGITAERVLAWVRMLPGLLASEEAELPEDAESVPAETPEIT